MTTPLSAAGRRATMLGCGHRSQRPTSHCANHRIPPCVYDRSFPPTSMPVLELNQTRSMPSAPSTNAPLPVRGDRGAGQRVRQSNYRWFCECYDDFCYLVRVVVADTHRRRGVGSLIYDSAEAGAAERMTLEVCVEPPNAASLAFHASRGFVEVGERSRTTARPPPSRSAAHAPAPRPIRSASKASGSCDARFARARRRYRQIWAPPINHRTYCTDIAQVYECAA